MTITDLGILNLTEEQEAKIGWAHHLLPDGLTGFTRVNGHHAVEGNRSLTFEEIETIRDGLQTFIPPLTSTEQIRKQKEQALKDANDFESFKTAVLRFLEIK